MSAPRQAPVFLERANYRQRRLIDVARMVPVLGVVLWLIPLLWSGQDQPPDGNSTALLYVFGVWVVLIGLSALVVRKLSPDESGPPAAPTAR